MRWLACTLLSLVVFAAGVRADEIRLKDGSKIVGTVVGYEDGAFKVETSYGFATVRKDSIAEIIPTDTKQTPGPPKAAPSKPAEQPTPATATPATPAPAAPATPPSVKPAVSAEAKPQPASAPKPQLQPASAPKPSPVPTPPPAAAASRPAAAPANPVAPAPPAAPASVSAASAAVPAAAPPAPPAPPPPLPPEPLRVQETVRGNLYINETYGFQMYRPPTWDLIADARAALPNAITALGTSDETTLFVMSRDRAKDSLDQQSAATEKTLRDIYGNYQPLPATRITIGGLPAIERHFHGTLDKSDWSVTLVTLVRGSDAFTILAMTGADSELVQFQENVIAKAIGSLEFTTPISQAR